MTFDQRTAYDPDTLVDDPNDWERPRPTPAPAPATLPPEDLTVQVHGDDGAWHRRAIGGQSSACGAHVFFGRFQHALRHESYEGHICREGCFSDYELAESERVNDLKRAEFARANREGDDR